MFHAYRMSFNRSPMKLSQRDKEEIVVAINAEITTKELANTYGVSSTNIRNIYREKTGKGVKRVIKLSQQDQEAIVAALQSGTATMKDLANTYTVAQTTISHTFKQVRFVLVVGRVSWRFSAHFCDEKVSKGPMIVLTRVRRCAERASLVSMNGLLACSHGSLELAQSVSNRTLFPRSPIIPTCRKKKLWQNSRQEKPQKNCI